MTGRDARSNIGADMSVYNYSGPREAPVLKRDLAFFGIVFAALLGLPTLFAGLASDDGVAGAILLAGIFATVGGAFGAGAGGLWFLARSAKYKRWRAKADPYFAKVSEYINSFLRKEVTSFGASQSEGVYQPKKGEIVYWAGPATMNTMRTKTERINHSGPRMRVKIAKGLYYTAGSTSVQRVQREYMHQEGSGTLLITNKRVQFVNAGASGSNWMKTYNGISSWERFTDGLMIRPGSGKAKLFLLPDAGREPAADTELLAVILQVGCDGYPDEPLPATGTDLELSADEAFEEAFVAGEAAD